MTDPIQNIAERKCRRRPNEDFVGLATGAISD